MDNKKLMRRKISIFMSILVLLPIILYLQICMIMPNRLMLLEDEEYIYNIHAPIHFYAKVDRSGVLSLNGEIIEDRYKIDLNSPLVIKSKQKGKINVDLSLFGIIPFRSLSVDVIPKMNVVPCGNTIGVKLYTDGILIVGIAEFDGENGEKFTPWEDAGLIPGDIIESINDIKIKDIEHLTEIINQSQGRVLRMTISRDHKVIDTKIQPKKSKEDEKYKLGLWVRDSTAGIGTLTFYDPDSKYFAALGHGITDVDTNNLLTVGNGSILKSTIISIRKGQKGEPGELKGVFMQADDSLGSIIKNTEYGIFGKLYSDIDDSLAPIPVGLRTQVKEGPAYILSNIQGEKVEKFDIEIQKVITQNTEKGKGMVIKITDPRLLKATGGIVQGMSGSPIIQNDKLVGGVTHVFVNDPTRGYGIFIEWMLRGVADSLSNS